LRKRDNYRAAFDDFDAKKIARYDARKIAELLCDEGIIRNRLKVNYPKRKGIFGVQKNQISRRSDPNPRQGFNGGQPPFSGRRDGLCYRLHGSKSKRLPLLAAWQIAENKHDPRNHTKRTK
jgi:hypothetical protein